MKTVTMILCTALLLLSLPGEILAQEAKPIQLALLAPVQLFPESTPISGLRLNLLYGKNTSVTGIDLGLINHTTSGKSIGVQWGLIGIADTDFLGWQNNSVNITKRDFEGFQWGLVNVVGNGNGFMLGFVNYAQSMKGLQIGLVNVIKQGGQFPVFPIVNWSF